MTGSTFSGKGLGLKDTLKPGHPKWAWKTLPVSIVNALDGSRDSEDVSL